MWPISIHLSILTLFHGLAWEGEGQRRYCEMASSPAHYSIEKSDVSRRVIHIPNPLNYLKLAEVIVKNESKVF